MMTTQFFEDKNIFSVLSFSWTAIALIHLDVVYSLSIPLRDSSVYEGGAMYKKWKEDS